MWSMEGDNRYTMSVVLQTSDQCQYIRFYSLLLLCRECKDYSGWNSYLEGKIDLKNLLILKFSKNYGLGSFKTFSS